LGNFAVILTIFLATFFKHLTPQHRWFYIGLIVAILITSRSRMATALVIISVIVYFLVRFFPVWINLFWFPFFVFISFITFFYIGSTVDPYGNLGDTIFGRLFHTSFLFFQMDLYNFILGDPSVLGRYRDSGLIYFLNSMTLFGLIGFWLYFFTVIRPVTREQMILLTLASIYFYATLAVSGTSAFSIKTAALLWVLIGFAASAERIHAITNRAKGAMQ
jgi:hypothetical protein